MFGLEESYGCLAGTYARDKDACSAVVMLCEVAAYYKNRNMTLWDGINELYREYGAYAEELSYIVLQGKEGLERIDAIMNQLRANAPKQFGDFEVEAVRDYKTGITMNFDTGKVGQTGLPVSNVLYYELQNGAWCAVRPSGTEPKIKFYIGAKSNSLENAKKLCKNISEALLALAD